MITCHRCGRPPVKPIDGDNGWMCAACFADMKDTQPERGGREACICCGKLRCDGHDGDAWKRCAKRYRDWSLQTERKCLALLEEHGIAAPDPTRSKAVDQRRAQGGEADPLREATEAEVYAALGYERDADGYWSRTDGGQSHHYWGDPYRDTNFINDFLAHRRKALEAGVGRGGAV